MSASTSQRYLPPFSPWPQEYAVVDDAPENRHAYTRDEAIQMVWRRRNWTCDFRWTGVLRSSHEQLDGKDPRASWVISDPSTREHRPGIPGGEQDDIPYSFLLHPGGSLTLPTPPEEDSASPESAGDTEEVPWYAAATSVLFAHTPLCVLYGPSGQASDAFVPWLGLDHGAAQYIGSSGGLNGPWMKRVGTDYYPSMGALGYIQIDPFPLTVDSTQNQWPASNGWEPEYRWPWPRVRIVVSDRILPFEETLTGNDGAIYTVRKAVNGTLILDGHELAGYGYIMEELSPYSDATSEGHGFPLMELPDDGAGSQFILRAGWREDLATWYTFGGLYDGSTGATNGEFTPLTWPFP